jgi:hypothetical protein
MHTLDVVFISLRGIFGFYNKTKVIIITSLRMWWLTCEVTQVELGSDPLDLGLIYRPFTQASSSIFWCPEADAFAN